MQKRFIAVSIAAAALALMLSFSTSTARADSIRFSDFKSGSFAPGPSSCDFGCVLNSVFAADTMQISSLFSDKHEELSASSRFAWEDWSNSFSGPFGHPTGSHRVRLVSRDGEGDGDRGDGDTAVPEPGSLLLASFGLMGLVLLRRTRHRNPPFPPAAV